MTATPNIPMREFIDEHPAALRNWIEQTLDGRLRIFPIFL